MKVAVIFVLLFATVICRPAKKISSSDSSEEVVRRPALRKQALIASKSRVIPPQRVVAAPVDKSPETSDEVAVVVPQAVVEVKAAMVDLVAPTETSTVDSDEDDDDDDETEEDETEEDEDESDSDSEESSTLSPVTVTPVIVTEEPIVETTVDAILPTIITDPDSGRGDNIGGYPSDYKSTVYVEEKSYHKVPAPYKSYGYVDSGKKTPYGEIHGNEVEKSPKVYKQAFQIHTDFLEEDTSTPEVETQGLDMSSSISQDQDMSHRQTTLPEEETAGTSDTTASKSQSSSTPQEEEESASSDIASSSQDVEEEESESSEEATATPGAADSDSDEEDSDESDSDEEGAGPDVTTDMPLVITAK